MFGFKISPVSSLGQGCISILVFVCLFQLHLSLSLGSSGDDLVEETEAIQSLNLLLKSIGATLTDVDDIIFK